MREFDEEESVDSSVAMALGKQRELRERRGASTQWARTQVQLRRKRIVLVGDARLGRGQEGARRCLRGRGDRVRAREKNRSWGHEGGAEPHGRRPTRSRGKGQQRRRERGREGAGERLGRKTRP